MIRSMIRSLPKPLLAALVFAVLASFRPPGARADEVRVLTAGAFKPVLEAMVPSFEQRTGNKVTIDNDTVGALIRRISGGEPFDLLIATRVAIVELGREGKVATETSTRLGRTGIGVAVKTGAPLPDIKTVATFRAALLAAHKVAFLDPSSGGSSGVYLSQLFDRLGITEEMRTRAVLVQGGLVATRVADGDADLAIHQTSEILAVPGVTLVGPIPDAIQSYTAYDGAIARRTKVARAARALLDTLAGPEAAKIIREKGMLVP